jgi:pantoate--beta-alanine ligase
VVSIFVNPTQFGPAEDFQSYPRDIPRDLAMLEIEGVDAVFMPGLEDMYPEGYDTWITLETLTRRLEGEMRPGHFRGVATVCAKLFNIVRPARSYFGQKDAQQVLVIKKMVSDLEMNLEVVALPTVREQDGLAMSSRNVYLNSAERQSATVLYRALQLAESLWRGGERDANVIRAKMADLIKKEPLAMIHYISVADCRTLQEKEAVDPQTIVSLAVFIGKTRLIDNIFLTAPAAPSDTLP